MQDFHTDLPVFFISYLRGSHSTFNRSVFGFPAVVVVFLSLMPALWEQHWDELLHSYLVNEHDKDNFFFSFYEAGWFITAW